MKLMALRIPPGWRVERTVFYDIDPPSPDGDGDPTVFIEDVASFRFRRVRSNGQKDEYVADLGWYPDQDPSGQFVLTLMTATGEETLAEFSSADRWAVRDRLEEWMDQVYRARDQPQLTRWLTKDAGG